MINTLPELILSKVCEYYKIDKSKLTGKSRKPELVKARQIYSFLCDSMTQVTREKIGEIINRDHSTITYGIYKTEDLMSVYLNLKIEVNEITELIEAKRCSIEVRNVDLLHQSQMNSKFLESWAI